MSCVIGKRTVLRPSSKAFKGFVSGLNSLVSARQGNLTLLWTVFHHLCSNLVLFPLKIGENVFIDDDCIIKCLSIGSNVKIGRNSVIVRDSFA